MKRNPSLKKPLTEAERLYFVHVPKCAGTSFISLLDERYCSNEILPIHYDLGKFEKEYANSQLPQYKFIRGHFPYDSVVSHLPETPRVITFLRDPITQFVSHFEMRQRVPDPLVGIQSTLQKLTLDEFLERKDFLFDPANRVLFANWATWLMGGITRAKSGKEIPNLELAKERLSSFDFVGIVERYQTALDLFCYIFDFPIINNQRELNVSPNRDARNGIPEKTLQRLVEVQYADMELYQLGLKLFNRQCALMSEERTGGVAGEFEINKPLLNSISFDFCRVDPGMGWHVGERHPVYGAIRWSGSEVVSKLFLPISKTTDARVEFHVVAWIKQEILESLELFINGEKISLEREKNIKIEGFIFKGMIRKSVLQKRPGVSEFVFMIKETLRPVDLDAGNLDERQIGLCYNWLSLESVGS
jgi:hypothetical protein